MASSVTSRGSSRAGEDAAAEARCGAGVIGTLGAVALLGDVQREPGLRQLVQQLQRENDALRVPGEVPGIRTNSTLHY